MAVLTTLRLQAAAPICAQGSQSGQTQPLVTGALCGAGLAPLTTAHWCHGDRLRPRRTLPVGSSLPRVGSDRKVGRSGLCGLSPCCPLPAVCHISPCIPLEDGKEGRRAVRLKELVHREGNQESGQKHFPPSSTLFVESKWTVTVLK